MRTKIFLFLLAVTVVMTSPFDRVKSQSNVDQILTNEAERITKDHFKYTSTTPNGAKVFSVKKATDKMLKAIDTGLFDLFAIARKHKFKKRLNYSDYTIFIAKADRTIDSNKNYSPDIAVDAGQYAGSDYDQGGFIYAAGMVIAYSPCAFVIADRDKDFDGASDIVRFEGEHLILYHNDRRLYEKTADHSNGGGHPILK